MNTTINPSTRTIRPAHRPKALQPAMTPNPNAPIPDPTTPERDDMYTIYQHIDPPESPVAVGVTLPRCADGHGTLTPLFFSDDLVDIGRAKAICGKCELAASCLSGALEREEPWGVWGGELLLSGRIVTNKRPCGRPPKVPRPELVIDELGVVGSVA